MFGLEILAIVVGELIVKAIDYFIIAINNEDQNHRTCAAIQPNYQIETLGLHLESEE
jgi:hypothetical protein